MADPPDDAASSRCFLRDARRRLNARNVASTAAPATVVFYGDAEQF